MTKAIIFDMDGTLLDSMHVWDDVGSTYLRNQNIQPHAALQERIACMSIAESCAYIQTQYQLGKSIKQIQMDIEQIVEQRYLQDISLKSGMKACIEKCLKQGLTLCILSASSEVMVTNAMKRNGILSAFSYVMTCEKVGYSKQQPELYQKVLQEIGIEKHECIFVEDAFHAITCMKKEGYYVVAVYDETNEQNWNDICTIADEHYRDITNWEVTTCKKS